ncbi:A-type potassium channel modulatory protein KCNIP1-like isoform X2 [Convolutriloba macropyga]|uniref:A-type potassium channel modulatory protein KCNIP1-like isoform X2 n=1 Tax=Convolutriloba macropyga TaxID=536237 RepID=UPI003F521D5B
MSHQDPDEIGADMIRHRPSSLKHLASTSGFSEEQLKILYRGFKQECPNGYLTETRLKNVMTQLFPFGDSSAYSKSLWRAINPSGLTLLSFEDFLTSLTVLLLGTLEQKIMWVFNLYDVDQDGSINVNDLGKTIEAIHDLIKPTNGTSANIEPFESTFRRSLSRLDTDRDGVISREEFFNYMRKREIEEILTSFDVSLITTAR